MYSWFKGNPDDFSFQEREIGGDLCVLITPKDITIKWDDNNKFYRSSIWRVSDGFPVSLGYRKFTNFQEQPSFEPVDNNSGYPIVVEKVDGSCIICSYYKGQFIVRTRGTFDAYEAFPNNAKELKQLIEFRQIEKVCKLFVKDKQTDTLHFSIIFEYVSPNNQIVKRYDKPDLYLTGIILHNDYSYEIQPRLDVFAKIHGNFIPWKRPKTYELKLCATDLSAFFKDFKDNTEGAVCYFNEGQTLKKMKTDWYLNLHHVRFAFRSPKLILNYIIDNNLINLSLTCDEFNQSVIDSLSNQFDYEIITYIKPSIELICKDVYEKVINKINIHKKYYSLLPENALIKDVIDLIKSNSDIIESLIWLQYRNKPFNGKVYRNLYKL